MQTTLNIKSTLTVSILLYPFNKKTNQIFMTACVKIKREAKEMEMLILFGLRIRDGDMGCAEEMEMMHRNKKRS